MHTRYLLLLLCGACGFAPATDELASHVTSELRTHGDVLDAPPWLLSVHASGTWLAPTAAGDIRRGWADARVLNVRYHKRVLAEVIASYEGGAHITTLHPAQHRGTLADAERWGTDAIEVHPHGPHGKPLEGDVFVRFRMQHDANGDGQDEMVQTPWSVLFDAGGGEPPRDDPWAKGLTSPVRSIGDGGSQPELRFAPFDDPGGMVLREIDAVIAAQRADGERHTIHAAIFNINDHRIVARLVEAHRAGVEVRLITDAKKLRPQSGWLTGDDVLLAAGVPLLGIGYGGAAAMHLKVALFDGQKVATGSANWEWGSSFENHESMLLSEDREVVTAYAQRFEQLAGAAVRPREGSQDVVFGPDEQPYRRLGALIDAAQHSVHVAMFTAKDFTWDEGKSLFAKLAAAKQRGLDVILVTDQGVAEGEEYFGVISPDDQTDEWLETQGVRVIRADVPFARYASMHHKFMVIDGVTTAVGAFNWYWDSAFINDEDVWVVNDAALAARFEGEIADLSRRYDPTYDQYPWPMVDLTFEVHHAGTMYGEQVVVLGELKELFEFRAPLVLDGSAYPIWRKSLALPAGVRSEWKLAVRRRDGSLRWEGGENRLLTVQTSVNAQTVQARFR